MCRDYNEIESFHAAITFPCWVTLRLFYRITPNTNRRQMTYMKMEEMNLYIFSYIRLYVPFSFHYIVIVKLPLVVHMTICEHIFPSAKNVFIPYAICRKLTTDPRFERSAFVMLDKQFKLI